MRRNPDELPLSMEIVHGEATVGQHSEIARRSTTANDRIGQFSPINFAVPQVARCLSRIDFDDDPTVFGVGRLEAGATRGYHKIDTDPTPRVPGNCREELFCKGMELVVRAICKGALSTGIGDGALEVIQGMESLFKGAERIEIDSVRGSLASDDCKAGWGSVHPGLHNPIRGRLPKWV